MTTIVLKQAPNTYTVHKNAIYWNKNTVCKLSGYSPLSNYKTTFKQQLNCENDAK